MRTYVRRVLTPPPFPFLLQLVFSFSARLLWPLYTVYLLLSAVAQSMKKIRFGPFLSFLFSPPPPLFFFLSLSRVELPGRCSGQNAFAQMSLHLTQHVDLLYLLTFKRKVLRKLRFSRAKTANGKEARNLKGN